MLTYFKLQFKMFNRQLSDFGLHPVIAYILIAFVFIGLSVYLFHKTIYAPWLFLAASMSLPLKLGETKRNDFLKTIFSKRDYLLIRNFENLISNFPFTVWLMYTHCYLQTMLLILLTILLSFVKVNPVYNRVLPTPFGKHPFEFTQGFRKSFYVIACMCLLTIISIVSGNFNLGVFSLVILFLIILSFYSEPESEFDVWVYSHKPFNFLAYKTKTAILFSGMLTLPITVCLAITFPAKMNILIIVQLVGFVYVLSMILAKYTAFPSGINIPQGILLATGLVFPPLLIFLIPYFYLKAIKQLSFYLA